MKIKCTCKSVYQDKRYGKGMRIANVTGKDSGRCTVCGNVKLKK